MMEPDTAALNAGARKAVDAYGKTVGESLDTAVTYLRDRPQRLDEYIRALKSRSAWVRREGYRNSSNGYRPTSGASRGHGFNLVERRLPETDVNQPVDNAWRLRRC